MHLCLFSSLFVFLVTCNKLLVFPLQVPATKARAFKVYARPLLEYASQAWSPYQLKDIKRIESIQRRFTKRLYLVYLI